MEDASQYAKMKVADLKKELKTRGLAVTGNKNELVERLLAAEGHAPIASVEGDDEEFDEEEILGGDMDTSDISKITPQEEEAALSGANIKVKKALPKNTPKKNGKLNLKRTEPVPAAKETKAASPKKAAAAAADKKKAKEQENIEPPKKVVKVDDEDEDSGEKSAMEKRAERFGIPMTEEAKKQARAARFGELTNGTVKGSTKLSGTNVGIDIDKLKARAERFGEITSKSLTKVEELEKKKTRMERFGLDAPKTNEAEVDAAKAARAARFAKPEQKTEEKPEKKTEEKPEKKTEVTAQ